MKTRYRDQVAELREIRSAMRLDDTVCDIGANKGSYIFWLSRWAPQGQVVAFEPQEQLASYLQNICTALNLKNVRVEGKAVHSRSGTLDLYIPGGGRFHPEPHSTPEYPRANNVALCLSLSLRLTNIFLQTLALAL